MLETIREFGRERLTESSEEQNVRAAHAAYVLTMVEEAAAEFFYRHRARRGAPGRRA